MAQEARNARSQGPPDRGQHHDPRLKVGSDNVIAGGFRFNTHASDFKAGPPVTWTEKLTGHFWGIHLPGQGVVYHESGQYWQDVTESFPENLYSDAVHVVRVVACLHDLRLLNQVLPLWRHTG